MIIFNREHDNVATQAKRTLFQTIHLMVVMSSSVSIIIASG